MTVQTPQDEKNENLSVHDNYFFGSQNVKTRTATSQKA